MAWIAEHTKTILSLHKTHDWRVLFSRFRFEAQKLWRTTEDVVEAMQDFPGFIMAAWTPPSSEKELSRTFYASFADAKAARAAVLGLSDQTDLLSNKGLTFA